MDKLRMSIVNSYELCPFLTEELYGSLGVKCDKEEESNIYADFGTMLHKLFETYGIKLQKNIVWTQDEIKKEFDKQCIKLRKIHLELNTEWIDSGYAQIEWFYDKYGLTVPLKTEMQFDNLILIDGIDLPFTGTIDRIDGVMEQGYLHLRDYKTGSSKKYTKNELSSNLQATIYSLACKKLYGVLPEYFTFIFTKDRKEKTIRITEDFLERGIARIKKNYELMKQDIWDTGGNHTEYFCKNFCSSQTCIIKNKPVSSGWKDIKRKSS